MDLVILNLFSLSLSLSLSRSLSVLVFVTFVLFSFWSFLGGGFVMFDAGCVVMPTVTSGVAPGCLIH